MHGFRFALLPPALIALLADPALPAAVRRVPVDHARITDALAACAPGDTVRVAAGTYSDAANGEVFPLAVTTAGVVLEGSGMGASVLDAAGTASVLRCAAPGVRVTGFTITGGRDSLGAGVRIESGDAQVDHDLIVDNAAVLRGSGVWAAPGSTPWIHHDVVWRSTDALPGSSGDPHGIQLTGSNALVEYNTIGRGDSNSLIIENGAEPVVQGNIFYQNGSVALHRGRGICALGGPGSIIRDNVFFGNVLAAILVVLQGAQDITAQQANDLSPGDGIYGNLDADPALVDADGLDLHLAAGSPAIDAGYELSPLDPDGTRADAGAFWFDQSGVTGVPRDADAVGLELTAAPNPFRGRTLLAFALPRAGRVLLAVHDARGRIVRSLLDETLAAGPRGAAWDGRDGRGVRVAGGVYFVRLEFDGARTAERIVLVP